MNQTIETIKNHRSIRTYLDKDVSEEQLNEILNSVQAMPTSINGQQVSVIVIKNKDTKKKIAEIAGGQPWIEKAPVFLVFVADFYKSHLGAIKSGNEQIIHESIEGTLVGTFDAGLAMGAAIISAESLGLGIVPIGGIRKEPDEMIKLLNLPKYTFPVAGLCIGHPENLSRQKPRLHKNSFIHEEIYHVENLESHIEEYDNLMEVYLEEVGRGKEHNWSAYTSGIYKHVYFPKVHPSLIKQGFKNDK